MISGFVILMTLERARSAGAFLAARAARLYPAFWAALLITFGVGVAAPLPGQSLTVGDLLYNATMAPAWLKHAAVDDVYWTLAYEAGFYCTMALAFVTGQLQRLERWCAVWLALSVAFIAEPRLVPHPLNYLLSISEYTHLFVTGIIAWRIRARGPTRLRVGLLAAALLVAVLRLTPMEFAYYALSAGVFLLAVFGRLEAIATAPLLFLGAISYPLYLIHQMVGYRIIMALSAAGLPYAADVAIAALAMIALATALHVLIEKPGERLLRRRLLRA
jgi:peptidoglycan/LPS O-acetylase OafA/YrhL